MYAYLEADGLGALGLSPDDDNADGGDDAKQRYYSDPYSLPLYDVLKPYCQH